ncbi:hypothetical protein RchiOBHm_Chr4g0439591 [Rosa chinensis]|uniref:Transmembrane protein n=1 Tax=Rosa chinensis TaxID=74649 RepID=A0A2P6R2X8_ROSCH|nr:hypothetical protein RchiOBHm_Chr4g0439591 [Rosa chinensis]
MRMRIGMDGFVEGLIQMKEMRFERWLLEKWGIKVLGGRAMALVMTVGIGAWSCLAWDWDLLVLGFLKKVLSRVWMELMGC